MLFNYDKNPQTRVEPEIKKRKTKLLEDKVSSENLNERSSEELDSQIQLKDLLHLKINQETLDDLARQKASLLQSSEFKCKSQVKLT